MQATIQTRSCRAPRVSGPSRPAAPSRVVRARIASTLVRDVENYSVAQMSFSAPMDPESLSKKLEAKTKALIALEEQEAQERWPTVRIRFQKEVGLGDAWKVVGRVPELGRFTPTIAPYMTWSQGHWWTYEGRVRPGTWLFKFLVRRSDGAYVWESGSDRVLDVPDTAGPDDVLEMEISDVKLGP